MSDSRSPELAAWIEDFATEASQDDRVEDFVRRVDDLILEQIPDLADDPVLVDELHQSTRSHWRSFLVTLPEREPRPTLPEPAIDFARSLARRRVDLGVLLKVYRAGGEATFQYFADSTTSVSDESPTRDELVVFFWNRANRWIDDAIEQLIETFYAEREQMLAGTLARRADTVAELLDARVTDVEAASQVLAHPVHLWQTALVVWTPEARPGSSEALTVIANACAEELEAPRPLTTAAGSRDLWCWIATPAAPETSRLDRLEERLVEHDAKLAVGLPARGAEGFRASHLEARAAQRVAVEAGTTPPIVEYADVELLCVVADDELLRRMVVREIGPLCGADKNLAPLRKTLLTFLTHRQNVRLTAEQLFVHENTVRYRLGRAEELLERSLIDRVAQLELALRYVELHGPRV